MDSKILMRGHKKKLCKSVDGAHVYIRSNSHRVGKIIDITPEGVYYKYIENSGGQLITKSYQKETIFLSSPGHYVAYLSFIIISDYEITGGPSFNFVRIRIRHAQCIELSSQLYSFEITFIIIVII